VDQSLPLLLLLLSGTVAGVDGLEHRMIQVCRTDRCMWKSDDGDAV